MKFLLLCCPIFITPIKQNKIQCTFLSSGHTTFLQTELVSRIKTFLLSSLRLAYLMGVRSSSKRSHVQWTPSNQHRTCILVKLPDPLSKAFFANPQGIFQVSDTSSLFQSWHPRSKRVILLFHQTDFVDQPPSILVVLSQPTSFRVSHFPHPATSAEKVY